jgi:hypothetical protein
MKCNCGKEIGIKLFCDDCLAKMNKEMDKIRDCLKKAVSKFENGKREIEERLKYVKTVLPYSLKK